MVLHGGNILKWREAFLNGRTQFFKVNGVQSDPAPVLSGILQGSVLGPILFVIYINDLPIAVKSEADDTKILQQITSRDDAANLQSDIDSLGLWSNGPFNFTLTNVTLSIFQCNAYSTTIGQHEFEHVFKEKDLSVAFHSELKFEEHISTMVGKANAITGLIRRSNVILI